MLELIRLCDCDTRDFTAKYCIWLLPVSCFSTQLYEELGKGLHVLKIYVCSRNQV